MSPSPAISTPPLESNDAKVQDVARDYQGLEHDARPTMYRSFNQWPWFNLTVALRTQGDPTTLIAQAREAIWSIDRDVPLSNIRAMDQTVALSIARPRFYATMLLAFAAVALALGAVGLFGVLSFVVSRRTREIGLRMALGAFERDVLGMMVKRGLSLGILGTAIGSSFNFGNSIRGGAALRVIGRE